MPAPRVFLAMMRLLLFRRIVMFAPRVLKLALVSASPHKRAWLNAVWDDFKFLAVNSEACAGYRDMSKRQISSYVAAEPQKFRKSVLTAVAESRINLKDTWAYSRASRGHGVYPCHTCGCVLLPMLRQCVARTNANSCCCR